MSHLPADDPSHRGIMAQPLGVVDLLVFGKPTEHRLPQHTDKSVPAVPAGAGIGEPLAGQIRKAECVVEFAGRQAAQHRTPFDFTAGFVMTSASKSA
jgi:hypothetical protein